MRDLTEILDVQAEVVDQNHANAGFVIASILAFLIPGVGLALGPIVTIIFLAIDANQDSSVDPDEMVLKIWLTLPFTI